MTSLIWDFLFPDARKFPNSRRANSEEIPDAGKTMGNLLIGPQGSGKSTYASNSTVEYRKRYPERAILLIDNAGSDADKTIERIAQEPNWEELTENIIYIDAGNPEYVVPFPEFSPLYGTTYEEQIYRVSTNLQNLSPELVKGAPFVAGLGLQEILPQLCRLLTSIQNEYKQTWQITEARRLLTDTKLLAKMVVEFGKFCPTARDFFLYEYFPLPQHEKELRTYAIRSLLGILEAPETTAGVGYFEPLWTPKEMIEKGQFVIYNAERLKNRKPLQHYHITQVFSTFMAEINKRRPGNPDDLPVDLWLHEVATLFKIPSMAPDIAELAPQYRSRGLQLNMVMQNLEQLSEELRPHIWSLGNIVCFGLKNKDEAYEMAKQLFPYDPLSVKVSGKTSTQQDLMEPDRGQYLQIADQLQTLKHREFVMRRYLKESKQDDFIRWVPKTKDIPNKKPFIDPQELKERLLKKRAVRVSDALEAIARRIPKNEMQNKKKKGTPPKVG